MTILEELISWLDSASTGAQNTEFESYLKQASDPEVKRAVQQIIATAVKHTAKSVTIELDKPFTHTFFSFGDTQNSSTEISVNPIAVLFHLLAHRDEVCRLNGNFVIRSVIKFKSVQVRVDIETKCSTNDSDENKFRAQILALSNIRSFSSVQPPQTTEPSLNRIETIIQNEQPIRGAEAFLVSSNNKPKFDADDIALSELNTEKEKAVRPARDKSLLLVIDDDADQRTILKRVFEMAGYQVEVAEDGIDGIVSATRLQPELIIVDFMMPELDGRETIRRLKQGERTSVIPVVALTAYADPDIELGLLQAGADDFCPKSVSKQVLLKRVERLIDSSQRESK